VRRGVVCTKQKQWNVQLRQPRRWTLSGAEKGERKRPLRLTAGAASLES
jgi:hypothetical protein